MLDASVMISLVLCIFGAFALFRFWVPAYPRDGSGSASSPLTAEVLAKHNELHRHAKRREGGDADTSPRSPAHGRRQISSRDALVLLNAAKEKYAQTEAALENALQGQDPSEVAAAEAKRERARKRFTRVVAKLQAVVKEARQAKRGAGSSRSTSESQALVSSASDVTTTEQSSYEINLTDSSVDCSNSSDAMGSEPSLSELPKAQPHTSQSSATDLITALGTSGTSASVGTSANTSAASSVVTEASPVVPRREQRGVQREHQGGREQQGAAPEQRLAQPERRSGGEQPEQRGSQRGQTRSELESALKSMHSELRTLTGERERA